MIKLFFMKFLSWVSSLFGRAKAFFKNRPVEPPKNVVVNKSYFIERGSAIKQRTRSVHGGSMNTKPRFIEFVEGTIKHYENVVSENEWHRRKLMWERKLEEQAA